MIGIDQMSGYFRFAYGVTELGDGIGVVPVAVGLFGLAEILLTAGQKNPPEVIRPRLRDLLPSRQEWREAHGPIWRGTGIGFLIGIIPGSAHVISTFVSYAIERKLSKRPEEFGKGAVAGVAGPESANNAATSGAFVPMLALGVPGRADRRAAAGRHDGARRDAGPAADPEATRSSSGASSPRCTWAT